MRFRLCQWVVAMMLPCNRKISNELEAPTTNQQLIAAQIAATIYCSTHCNQGVHINSYHIKLCYIMNEHIIYIPLFR